MESLIAERIKRLRERMSETQIDTLLVLTGENRRYLSGFTGQDTQFDESAGALIITRTDLILATDTRYELQASNERTSTRLSAPERVYRKSCQAS